MPPLRLRRFLYLDEKLTSEFLSQVGIDIYDEEAQTQTSELTRKRGAGLKAGPASAEAKRDSGDKLTASRTVRQTPEGNFASLVDMLEADGALQYLEGVDDAIWNDLRRGEAVEVECTLSVPLLVQIMVMAHSLPLEDLAATFGTQIDAQAKTVIEQIKMLGGMLNAIPVICELSGTPKYKFVVPINALNLRALISELNGEATIFATIEKKLKGRDKWSLVDALGFGNLPREVRREFDREAGKDQMMRDFTVGAPAAILSPVAIYR